MSTKVVTDLKCGVVLRGQWISKVTWKDEDYDIDDGIAVLMSVVRNQSSAQGEREGALDRLGMLSTQLNGRDCVEELIALYASMRTREEKGGLLLCLTKSQDRRGIPLLYEAVETETDPVVRLFAALGLTKWNVRRGVAELVSLCESREVLSPSRMPYVRDYALESFRNANARKAWGFAEEGVRKSIEGRADLNDDQKIALYIAEIKKWFAENEHRFPEWKPGDPLPAAQKLPPIPPGPESVLSLSAAFRPPPTVWTVAQEKEEEVSWQGKRYPAREGVDLLMKVALEPGSVADHFRAIERLRSLGSQLRNTERIPQLMKLYGRVTDRSEKVALLFCLAQSKDQRALPLFGEILDTRQEEYLRLPAAYGLALWNTRRGVRELIELLSVKQTESPIRYSGIIGDEAARLLSRLNYWKSWWAPEAALQAVAEARTEVHDEVLDSCHAELKKWFAENEERFPVWNVGDPLPERPAVEKYDPGSEGP